jgi:hypothetical protein
LTTSDLFLSIEKHMRGYADHKKVPMPKLDAAMKQYVMASVMNDGGGSLNPKTLMTVDIPRAYHSMRW